MADTLLIKANSQRYSRLKDGCVSMTFVTMEEIDNDGLALIDRFWQENGWLLFSRNTLTGEEAPEEDAEVEGQLTPSQYLRRCLFALHMARGGTKETFGGFYKKAMDQFASNVKNSFPEE